MMPSRKPRIMTQLFLGQLVLVAIGGSTLIVTAFLFAPAIFRKHMREAGIDTTSAQTHISEAFSSAFSLSLAIAMLTSLVACVLVAWYLVGRVGRPIENLEVTAESLSSELLRTQEDQARMMRDLAHELRTPIATIGALVDGLEDGVVQGDSHVWNTIRDQLQRLNRLSRDVRDVSHSQESSLEIQKISTDPFHIGELAISAWSQQFEKKGVSLEFLAANNLSMINADPMRVGQVLSNLLENALRHTPPQGTVELIVEEVAGGVQFKVRDSGDGISSSQMPHIFDRLFRGDTSRVSGDTGSGLGLTIARKIAESHHGTLLASSDGLGHGSTFIFTLPIE